LRLQQLAPWAAFVSAALVLIAAVSAVVWGVAATPISLSLGPPPPPPPWLGVVALLTLLTLLLWTLVSFPVTLRILRLRARTRAAIAYLGLGAAALPPLLCILLIAVQVSGAATGAVLPLMGLLFCAVSANLVITSVVGRQERSLEAAVPWLGFVCAALCLCMAVGLATREFILVALGSITVVLYMVWSIWVGVSLMSKGGRSPEE
jgi:hypothetical protein